MWVAPFCYAEANMPSRPPIYRPAHVPTREEAQAAYGQFRGSAASRGYGHRWRQARAAFLASHPACVAPGCTQPATDVDHIVPHKGDYALMWTETNWQPLCSACHSKKTRQGQ